jgi:hypothetical protein
MAGEVRRELVRSCCIMRATSEPLLASSQGLLHSPAPSVLRSMRAIVSAVGCMTLLGAPDAPERSRR